jgi:hypothetical protein
MRRAGKGWVAVLLTGACVALAWQVYRSAKTPISLAETAVAEERGAQQPLPPLEAERDCQMVPGASLSGIVERPLFVKSRRPGEVKVEAPPQGELDDLAVTGILISEQNRIALLLPKGTRDIMRLRVGDVYAGWSLAAIEQEAVIFRRDDGERRLELSFETRLRPPQQRRLSARQVQRAATEENQPSDAAQNQQHGEQQETAEQLVEAPEQEQEAEAPAKSD